MKEELIEARGKVVKLLPNASFRVMLENGSEMIAYTSGKVRKNKIRILAGDEVLVQITPYDPDRGRVVLRYKKEHNATNKYPDPDSNNPNKDA